MSIYSIIKKVIIGGALCFTYYSYASTYADFDSIGYMLKKEHILLSHNKSFINALNIDNISKANISIVGQRGDFTTYNQAKESLKYIIDVESYYRYNNKIMLYGKAGYSSLIKKDIGQSAFINPQKSPFDIIEFDENNIGDKKLNIYFIDTTLGYQINNTLSLGTGVSYTAANYAKYKDLRHKNTLMDISVSTGISYSIFKSIDLGLSYKYNNRVETISFNTYVETDKQILSIISFGNFYGRKETFGESGYTYSGSNSLGIPLSTISNLLGIQTNIRINKKLTIFNEVYANAIKSIYGIDSSISVIKLDNKEKEIGYRGKLKYNIQKISHIIETDVYYIKAKSYENSYRESTDKDNISKIIYYGKNLVNDLSTINSKLSYNLFYEKTNCEKICAGADISFLNRNSKTVIFPYYRNQNISSLSLTSRLDYKITKKNFSYIAGTSLTYRQGSGNIYQEGSYSNASDEKHKPSNRDDLLKKEYHYLVDPSIDAELRFKCLYMKEKQIKPFVGLNYSYLRSKKDIVYGKSMHRLELNIGCYF